MIDRLFEEAWPRATEWRRQRDIARATVRAIANRAADNGIFAQAWQYELDASDNDLRQAILRQVHL